MDFVFLLWKNSRCYFYSGCFCFAFGYRCLQNIEVGRLQHQYQYIQSKPDYTSNEILRQRFDLCHFRFHFTTRFF